MKRGAQDMAVGVLGGLLVGLIGGIRWLTTLAASGGPVSALAAWTQHHPIVFGMLLTVLAAVMYALVRRQAARRESHIVLLALSIVLGGIAYCALGRVASTVDAGSPGAWVWVAAVAVGALMIAVCARRPVAGAFAAAIGISFLPWSRCLGLITGDLLARQAVTYAPLPDASYWVQMLLSLLGLGLCIGLVSILLDRTRGLWAIWTASAVSVSVALCVSVVQMILLVVTMRSGLAPKAVLMASISAWVCVGVTIATAVHPWKPPASARALKAAPLFALVIAAAYAYGGLYGYSDYQALSRLHPDGVYAYIHFAADGSSRRTIDQSASSTKTLRAQDFLVRYPCSAYRTAALLVEAESQYEEWEFDRAAATLAQSSREYPLVDGYREILWAFADMANARPGTILRANRPDAAFAEWRSTVGAQTAADAAARLGFPRREYGLHSAYLDYLADRNPSLWSRESAGFSRARMDALDNMMDVGETRVPHGTVLVRVTGPSGPIRGARVVLVQPHPNAALPADSVQFTGAWTLPAWNAVWGVTDYRGMASIRNVVYGRYEVVLGLGLANWPPGTVAGQAPAGVTVDKDVVRCPPIQLVPSVRLVSPKAGGTVAAPVTVRWEPYPGADHYSVTVIAVNRSAEPGDTEVVRGSTCWTKANAVGDSTLIDSDHFTNGDRQLRAGRSYMWLVHACAADGRVLSSSEHYFDLREPTFAIEGDTTRKGAGGEASPASVGVAGSFTTKETTMPEGIQ